MAKQSFEAKWRKRLARWRRSGKTVTEFCRQEGVSKPTFYAWRKRLEDADPPAVEFVEVTPTVASAAAGIELEVAGTIVRLRDGFDVNDLRTVIAVLREWR
ncbi:MAG: transposase [Polyangiaceae bacterium]